MGIFPCLPADCLGTLLPGPLRLGCGAHIPIHGYPQNRPHGPSPSWPPRPSRWPTPPTRKSAVWSMTWCETMIDANGAGLAAPRSMFPCGWWCSRPPGEADPTPACRRRSVSTTPPPDRADKPPNRGAGPHYRGRLGGLPVGSGPARLGRAARPYPLSRPGPGGRTDRAGAPAAFTPRVVQHECDHLDGRLYIPRIGDLSRLIFESEIRHFQAAS